MTLRRTKVPVLFLLLLLATFWAMYAGDIFTNHALNAHRHQAWNAVRIKNFFQNGQCKPKIDLCDDGKEIHWCELDKIAIGLVKIGTKIITGFAARPEYWANRCGGAL